MQKSVLRRLVRGGVALIVIGLAYFALSMGWLTGQPMGYGPWDTQADRVIAVALVVIGVVLVVVGVRRRAVDPRPDEG